MKVYLNEINGIADAIVSMMMSRRTWTRETELEIRDMCKTVLSPEGAYSSLEPGELAIKRVIYQYKAYNDYVDKLVAWGWKHITLLKFVDISITVEGLHRGGQDDWDSHASRFHNRIIRSSTRLATFGDEMSEWYQDKIIPTDAALALLGITSPETLIKDGITYVKTTNGYIREDMKDNKDVKRGLYMLSIPSNFIFKINLTDWSHVYKERNNSGSANPEVKLCCESIADQLAQFQPKFTRELFDKIKC